MNSAEAQDRIEKEEIFQESQQALPFSTADVAVAVGNGDSSIKALKWTLETLMVAGSGMLHLLHVQHPLRVIQTPLGYLPFDQANEECRRQAKELQLFATQKLLQKYQRMCEKKKVDLKVHCMESSSIQGAVVEKISKLGISKLVLGSSSKSTLKKLLKGSRTEAIVAQNVPGFCAVMVVRNGRLSSVKDADQTSFYADSSSFSTNSHNSVSMLGTKDSLSKAGSNSTRSEKSSGYLTPYPRTDRILPYWTPSCTGSSLISNTGHEELFNQEVDLSHSPSKHSSVRVATGQLQSDTQDSLVVSSSGQHDVQCRSRSLGSEAMDRALSEVASTPGKTHAPIFDASTVCEPIGLADHENMPKSKIKISDFGELGALKSALIKEVRDDFCVALKLALKVSEERSLQAVTKQRGKYEELVMALSVATTEAESLKKEVDKVRQQAEADGSNYREALAKVEELKRELLNESELRRLAERESCKAKQDLMKLLRKLQRDFIEYSFAELEVATNNFAEDGKLGEGGYGNVYKGILNDVTVAIKVLRPGGKDGQQQFQHEVEVLSYIHHPHIVELFGACQERACIVYEYMENGSVEDRLACKHGTLPLPWYVRFRICFEVAIALVFLHNLAPNPIVHRDLKPGNILLDHSFVSKLSDAGLARWIPQDVTYSNTVYRETMPAGTFAYMDPEYLRTGSFGPHSDVFALGIVILQVLTGRPPVGVVNLVEAAIEEHRFHEVLDPLAGEWPLPEAEDLAKLGLLCAEPRRRDRPNLDAHVLAFLKKLQEMANNAVAITQIGGLQNGVLPSSYFCPLSQEVMRNPHIAADSFTYELHAIKKWLAEHDISPMTNLKLAHKELTKNCSLDFKIKSWKQELNRQHE